MTIAVVLRVEEVEDSLSSCFENAFTSLDCSSSVLAITNMRESPGSRKSAYTVPVASPDASECSTSMSLFRTSLVEDSAISPR